MQLSQNVGFILSCLFAASVPQAVKVDKIEFPCAHNPVRDPEVRAVW